MVSGSAQPSTCGPTTMPPTMRITTCGTRSRDSSAAASGVRAAIRLTMTRSIRPCWRLRANPLSMIGRGGYPVGRSGSSQNKLSVATQASQVGFTSAM